MTLSNSLELLLGRETEYTSMPSTVDLYSVTEPFVNDFIFSVSEDFLNWAKQAGETALKARVNTIKIINRFITNSLIIVLIQFIQMYRLFLAFPRRGNDKTPSDDTLGVLEGFISADSVVSEIGVPDPEGILVPVATEGFQVPVVVMLTAETMTFVSITA